MSRAFAPYPYVARRHEARLPPLHVRSEAQRHSVVIVGGGIVGLATALALARNGVRSVVLEADDSVCTGSRAICFSRRSLEILARHEAVGPFLATGLPWVGGRSFYRDAEVLRFSMPHADNQRLPPMINLQQYYVEDFLLAAAENTGLVDVRWQSRVAGISVSPQSVRLSIETPCGAYELEADWLVGCDGARSVVRETAGLRLHGTSYEGRYVIVDVALKSPRPTERLAWFDPPSNPGSTILMHRQPDDVWRIDYQLLDHEDPDTSVLPQNVIPRVASHLRMIGERADWAPIWISLYRANALTLDTYRAGRLLLAGDAAHLVPIFGVRGANSGFEDADNLAWKLALVIRGAAGEALLDSYCRERVQAARENLRQGMKSTEFMSPPSFGFQLMRTAVLDLATGNPAVRSLIDPRQTHPIRYGDSPLNRPDIEPWEGGPAPGSVATECPLMLYDEPNPREGHLTELLKPCFTAICFADTALPPAYLMELASRLRAAAVPLRICVVTTRAPEGPAAVPVGWDRGGAMAAMYGARHGSVYLFRPDGYVLARWHAPSAASVHQALQRALHPAAAPDRTVTS